MFWQAECVRNFEMKKTAYAGHNIAEPPSRWKATSGATDMSEAGRLKVLQDENRRLQAMAANLRLTNETLKAAIRKNG
jgi:hypothetical protein